MVTRFKIARILAGKKQIEVSRKTGIPVSTLSQIECGWRVPNSSQLKKLVKELPQLAKESEIEILSHG
jgi:transcriptional regulator with XRE-family HTH domain